MLQFFMHGQTGLDEIEEEGRVVFFSRRGARAVRRGERLQFQSRAVAG